MDRKTSKYDLVYDGIVRKIEGGKWSPGDRLPSEAALGEEYGVSLGTVQRSLRMLESEGLVVRRHGSGTYVAAALPMQNEILVHFFVADGKPENQSTPLPLYLKVLNITSTPRKGPWTRFLGHKGETIKIERIINVNLEFQLYTELYLERARFKQLLQVPKHQLDGPGLFRRMYDARQLPPRRFIYEMWLATPPADVAQHIQAGRRSTLHALGNARFRSSGCPAVLLDRLYSADQQTPADGRASERRCRQDTLFCRSRAPAAPGYGVRPQNHAPGSVDGQVAASLRSRGTPGSFALGRR